MCPRAERARRRLRVPQGALRLGCYGVWQEQLQVGLCGQSRAARSHTHMHQSNPQNPASQREGDARTEARAYTSVSEREGKIRTHRIASHRIASHRIASHACTDAPRTHARVLLRCRPQELGFEYKPLRNAIAAVMGDLASSVVKVPREVVTQRMQVAM
jgi:hypothetical protein